MSKLQETESCCLHANILDYYLRNVLADAQLAEQHQNRLTTVKHDLHRVRRDLEVNANCVCIKISLFLQQNILLLLI